MTTTGAGTKAPSTRTATEPPEDALHMPDIRDNPAYRASLERLDAAIRDHFALLERTGNEADANDTGATDTSIVTGWVLTIATTGINSEHGEFHDALVEYPDQLSPFTAAGLTRYTQRVLDHLVDDYTD